MVAIAQLMVLLAPAITATRGSALALAVAAALPGSGLILVVVLLPSRRRLTGEFPFPDRRPHPAE